MKKSIIAILAVFLAAALLVGAGSAAEVIYPYTNLSTYNILGHSLQLTTDGTQVVFVNAGGFINSTSFIVGTYKDVTATNSGMDYFLTYPDATISIQLTDKEGNVISGTDMNGKTVSKSSGLSFTAVPLKATHQVAALLFTTPAGGQTTIFGWESNGNVSSSFKVFPLNNDSADFQKISTGTWKVQAKFSESDPAFAGMPASILNGYSVKTFTVATTTNEITADKDEITRGQSFLVTITGTPNVTVPVEVNLKNNGLLLPNGQLFVEKTNTGFNVTLPASGKAIIQIDTNSSTKADKYDIKANFLNNEPVKKVTVNVVKGKVTVTADADSYYIGNKITLSGTNTETGEVYLYIKGSNKNLQLIPGEGGNITGDTDNNPITVETDNTWKKEFTIANKFDAGTYTIYAAADNFDVAANGYPFVTINDKVQYATAAITLKQPFLSATAASNTIAKGDDIKVTGTVEGTPNNLVYYVFGTNHFDWGKITTEEDGTYSQKIKTDGLATGQYFVVVQHPMYDKLFNVQPGNYGGVYKILNGTTKNAFTPTSSKYDVYSYATDGTDLIYRDYISAINTRQTANAAQAVCELIDEEYVDDIYVKLDFVVANAYMTINSVADQTQGATFKISGTTNVKVGEDVTIDVISTKFQAEPKTSVSAASYLVSTAKVVAGSNGVNTYEATFDGTPLAVDSYTAVATITRTNDDLKVSTTFNIVKGAATPVPTTTGTTAPVTPTATATATPTPASPGFGALIALAGLGAVAVLVLRRQ